MESWGNHLRNPRYILWQSCTTISYLSWDSRLVTQKMNQDEQDLEGERKCMREIMLTASSIIFPSFHFWKRLTVLWNHHLFSLNEWNFKSKKKENMKEIPLMKKTMTGIKWYDSSMSWDLLIGDAHWMVERFPAADSWFL